MKCVPRLGSSVYDDLQCAELITVLCAVSYQLAEIHIHTQDADKMVLSDPS